MTQEIKVIAIDLDGTLLNSDSQLSARNEAVLKKAMAQGIKVVLATGKTYYSARNLIKQLGLDTPGVYLQGLAIHYPDGSSRQIATLDPDILRTVITYAEDRGYDVVAYASNRVMARSTNKDIDELSEKYHDAPVESVGPLQNLVGRVPISKLLFMKRHDHRKINALRWQLNVQLDGKARLTQALPDMLELLPAGQSKGRGVKLLLKELGIDEKHLLAIGDGENDVEMIEMAGIGVAVGNANPKLKAVANHIVSTNDEDGVAEAVERFALKEEPKPEPTPEPAAVIEAQPEAAAPEAKPAEAEVKEANKEEESSKE